MKNFFTFCSAFVFTVLSSSASANVGEAYGFGSRTASLGGAGVAWGFDGYAAYHNPAGLAVESNKRLLISYGLLYMQPNFLPIENVVTQNNFNADSNPGSPVYGNVDTTSYRPTFGQEFGLSYRLFPDAWNFTFGIVSFLPISQFAYMDTGEAYVPEYVLYRARTQRPQIEMGVGADLGKGFHVGAGIHFAFALTSNASVFINTRPGTASQMRFTSSLKPKASPYFGLLYTSQDEPKSLTLGAVFRLPVVSDNAMTLNSAARVFGNFAAVDFNFTALSALFYDPMALELGGSWQHASWARFYAQVEYQVWSAFQVPALLIQQPQTTNCTGPSCGTVTITPGQVPTFTYLDTVVPRFGEEFRLSDLTTLRFGYAYRPSFLSAPPTSSGNYLDPPKHMINLGLGLDYGHFLGFETPCRLDFNLAYQYLVPQHVTKTAGNEAGNASDPKIGSPGYDVGGNIYGGGVNLSLAF